MHHIGPYRIETVLAKGARGLVYKGIHEGLDREVAIKAVSLGQGTDLEERKRLLAEARVQIRLQHSNIVATCDLIEEQGQVFVAAEYVEGTTLDVLLERRKGEGFALTEALGLFEQVLAALDHAHRQGVVHRNIKPANLMVRDGQVKVMDFAMALFRQTDAESAAYLSPEELMAAETDQRTDLYCAAVALYEMLAGRHPFQGAAGLDLVECHLSRIPPDLKSLVPDLPAGVSEAVAIALHKEPGRRFQSAEDFLRALREGAVGFLPVAPEPVESEPADRADPLPAPEIAPPPPLSRDRQRRLVAATFLLLGLGLVGSYGLWNAWYEPPAPPPRREAPPATPSPEPEREEPAPTPSPDPPVEVSPTPEPAVEPAPEREAATPPPVSNGPDPEEVRRLEIGRLREEARQGIEAAEADLQAEGFEAAQDKLDRLTAQVQRYPDEFPAEIATIRGLRRRLTDALVASEARRREIELQQAQWQRRVQQIEKLLEEGKYPEADNLARDLVNEAGVPETVADRARELSTQAKEELKRIWGTTQTGPTRNKLRKPPGS